MKIEFNEERALHIFSILERDWREKKGVFENIILPQDRWPSPSDPKACAHWFFYCALPQRGGLVSDDPFRLLATLYRIHPELFKPRLVACQWQPDRIARAFVTAAQALLGAANGGERSAGSLGYKIDEHAHSWHYNSCVLNNHWDGNLLNVFVGITKENDPFEAAFARVDYKQDKHRGTKGFVGMRRKIFSLLVIWLQERGIIPSFPCPIPVDFHALRVLWATGIISFPELAPFQNPVTNRQRKHPVPESFNGLTAIRVTEKIVDTIALWSQRFIVENGFSHLCINPALWILSRALCAGHFQNRSRKRGEFFVNSDALRANPALWPKKYRDPCGHCPINSHCTSVIGASTYYRYGLLVKRPRVAYPLLLPGVRWADHMPMPVQKKNRMYGGENGSGDGAL